MRHLFSSPLGAVAAPFGSLKKSSAGAAIVGDLLGGIFNLWGTQMTNASNEFMQRRQNEQNYQIWQESLAAQREH